MVGWLIDFLSLYFGGPAFDFRPGYIQDFIRTTLKATSGKTTDME